MGDEEGINKLCMQYPAFQMNANIARELKLNGDNLIIPNACAAGNFAIGYAYDLIQSGRLDYALTGGVDPFSRLAFTGFNRLLAVAPEKVRPFDKCRKGIMVGEGAGIVFIESLESALARNANIYAEIIGYGVSCDAYHITTPHPQAKGVLIAMERALENAGITVDDVDYVSPHGTGTKANDKAETYALKTFFGDRYKQVPASSIKSMLGHTMGAASAIEAATCALILKNGIIPPTINYEEPDPECDLDCVPNEARKKEMSIVLNNAYAFGGNNSSLVLKRFIKN
jgi:3-oxoacyl-[acyl-carrier-protein] synthase II